MMLRKTSPLRRALVWTSATGDIAPVAIFAVLLLLVRPDIGARLSVAVLTAGLLTRAVKTAVKRPRPPGPEDAEAKLLATWDPWSFPSGHASRAAALVTVLLPLLSPLGALGAVLWVLMLGLGRVGLGRHYLSDVTAGWVLGAIVAVALQA